MSIELPLDTMTVAEKVQLLETVWDSLCRESGDVQSPGWHRDVLDERTRRLQSGQATVSSWYDVKARIIRESARQERRFRDVPPCEKHFSLLAAADRLPVMPPILLDVVPRELRVTSRFRHARDRQEKTLKPRPDA